MEAKELRLGNLVYWNEAPKGESKLCEVLAIDEIEVKVFSHALDGQEVFNIEDDIEPIPLTEEWITKGLFKEVKPKAGIRKAYLRDGIRIEISNSGNYYYKGRIVYGLHHLQNLYFTLKGKELDI